MKKLLKAASRGTVYFLRFLALLWVFWPLIVAILLIAAGCIACLAAPTPIILYIIYRDLTTGEPVEVGTIIFLGIVQAISFLILYVCLDKNQGWSDFG